MEYNSKLLSGKTALITGASRGIGKAIAEMFAAHGANLILVSKSNASLLEELKVKLINCYNNCVEIYSCDVADFEQVKKIYQDIQSKKLSIDILVNNAGILKEAVIGMIREEDIHDVFQTNVFGTIYNTQFAVKAMLRQKRGSIINMSSVIGIHGNAGHSIYSATKAAVIGFTKSLSKELASLNIRVNAIAPGFIETDFVKHLSESLKEKNLASIKMKRFGMPEDVAKTALFLASDMSDYVTGQVIGVDGGVII